MSDIESVRAARLQLIDLGDEKTAATLDWCLSTPAAADAPEPVAKPVALRKAFSLLDRMPINEGYHDEIVETLDALRAAIAASQPAPVEENVLDLDKAFWEQLMQAAGESEWIPQEHYYVNDWVADCCNFLRTGSSISAPVSVPEVEIPEGLQCNVCDGEPGLRVLGSRAWTACSVCHGSGRTDVLGPYVPGTSRKKVDAAPTPSKGEA